MLFSFSRFTKPRWSQFSTPFSAKRKLSCLSASKVVNRVDEECEGFLPWLERKKAGFQISSKLYIGKSAYGRSLFASRSIQTGDCILRVPYNVQITADCLFLNLRKLLENEVGNVAKLAVVILLEQKIGQESEWAPYISCLPQWLDMHSTVNYFVFS
uniref:SET domain-containing protein n=1 Tax=Rhizophora mucronata TaxID=61149 RepID=A0A2P2KX21_RHIMU